MLQVYLNILLYLEGFIFKRKKLTLFLIVIAIFSTYSTTGILIMLILLFFMFKSTIKKKSNNGNFIDFFNFTFIFYCKNKCREKSRGRKIFFISKKIFGFNSSQRLYAFKHPFTGVGLDREHFQKYRSEFLMDDDFGSFIEESTGYERKAESTEKGSSNSITYLMRNMGFPTSIFLIYCLFKQKLFTIKKEFS